MSATTSEREAFEAYALRDGLNVKHRVVDDGLTYVALATETAWQFWQASRRSMPDARFAAWVAELLTKAESSGLHLDADKREILDKARSSLTPPAAIPAAPSDAAKMADRLDWAATSANFTDLVQTMQAASRLLRSLTQPTTVQQAETLTEDQIRDGFRDYDKELVARHRTAWQIWRDASVWALKTAPTAAPGDAGGEDNNAPR